MSAETTTSAPAAPATPVQGANPVPKLEARGENDFSRQIADQGGAGKTPTTSEQPVTTPTTPATTAQPAAATPATPATPAAKAGLDPDTLRTMVEAVASGLEGKKGTAAPTQPKELTPQEFNQKYGIPQVDAKVMQAILDADPAKGAQALQALILQAVRSGTLMSKDLYSAEIARLRGEIDPHISSWQSFQQKQAEEAAVKSFYSEHKDLVGEEPLVEEMTAALHARVASGQIKPFASQAEANKAVADAARKLVARMNKPGAKPAGNGASPEASAPPAREMSAASSAGRSGTGQPAKQSDAELVFGADAR